MLHNWNTWNVSKEVWIHTSHSHIREILLNFVMSKIHKIKQISVEVQVYIQETTFSHLNDIMYPNRGRELLIRFLICFPAFVPFNLLLCVRWIPNSPNRAGNSSSSLHVLYGRKHLIAALSSLEYFFVLADWIVIYCAPFLMFFSHRMKYRIS